MNFRKNFNRFISILIKKKKLIFFSRLFQIHTNLVLIGRLFKERNVPMTGSDVSGLEMLSEYLFPLRDESRQPPLRQGCSRISLSLIFSSSLDEDACAFNREKRTDLAEAARGSETINIYVLMYLKNALPRLSHLAYNSRSFLVD